VGTAEATSDEDRSHFVVREGLGDILGDIRENEPKKADTFIKR
jgi:hypothetical protein